MFDIVTVLKTTSKPPTVSCTVPTPPPRPHGETYLHQFELHSQNSTIFARSRWKVLGMCTSAGHVSRARHQGTPVEHASTSSEHATSTGTCSWQQSMSAEHASMILLWKKLPHKNKKQGGGIPKYCSKRWHTPGRERGVGRRRVGLDGLEAKFLRRCVAVSRIFDGGLAHPAPRLLYTTLLV